MATYTIEKLASSNYESWAQDMKFLLMERNLWTIVNEVEKEPKIKETSDGSTDAAFLQYKSRSNAAVSLIYLNIDPTYRKIIENFENPVIVWKELKEYFQPCSRAYHIEVFSQLCNCRIEPGETISLFSARLSRIGCKVRERDSNFSELYSCYQLLRYLPSQFDPVVQNVLRWKDSEFTYKNITQELVAEEVRLNLRDSDTRTVFAKPVSVVEKVVKRCYACNSSDHLVQWCPNKSFGGPRCSPSRGPRRSPSRGPRRSPSRGPRRSPSHGPRSSPIRGSRLSPAPGYRFSPERAPRSWSSGSSSSHSSHGVQNLENGGLSARSRPRSRQTNVGGPRGRSFKSPAYCKFKHSHFITANLSEGDGMSDWVFDTGASHHFCKDKSYFYEFCDMVNETMAVAIDNVTFPIEGKGSVKLRFGLRVLELKDVMYSSKLRKNLISGPRIDQSGLKFVGQAGEVKVIRHGKTFFKAVLKNGIYCVSPRVVDSNKRVTFAAPATANDQLELWHKRMSHISLSVIDRTCRMNGVVGLPRLKNSNLICDSCKIGKFKRVSFRSINRIRSRAPLELLYTDVWGPYHTRGRDGERFYVSIIDDYSKKVSLYPIKEKSNVSEIVIRHINRVENSLNRRVKFIRSDNGGEYLGHQLVVFLDQKGIDHEFTNTFTPEQNGLAERFNQTVVSGARTMLLESGMHESFWPEAMCHFTYTWNRVCHSHQYKTPFELYYGSKPSVRHLRQFGVLTYVGVPKPHRSKLDARAKRGYLVGYAFRTRGYRVWVPDMCRVVETINVSFDENKLFKDERSGFVMGSKPEDSETKITIPSQSFSDDVDAFTPSVFPREPVSRDSSSTPKKVLDVKSGEQSLKKVAWRRDPKMRSDKSRRDIYYYEVGKNQRLRSLNEVKNYCQRNYLKYEPHLFDFSTLNAYKGIVEVDQEDEPDASTDLEDEHEVDLEEEEANLSVSS